jgi:hypothetical protein
MCMYDDDWPAKVYRQQERRAAKDHRCAECNRTITKGERYHYVAAIWEDTWDTFRTCLQCRQVMRWLEVVCEGWMHGAIQEDLFEHVTGYESELRTRPLTRLARWMRADWLDGSGEVRSVESVRAVATEAIEAYRRQFAKAVA